MSRKLAGVVVAVAYALGGDLGWAGEEEPAVVVIGGDGAAGATELGPMRGELPAAMAGWVVTLDVVEPVGFEVLAGRVGMAAGVKVGVEERPGRIAGRGRRSSRRRPRCRSTIKGCCPGYWTGCRY